MRNSELKIVKKKGGRPFKYGEPTELCRIPVSFKPTLKVLLALWEKSQLETDFAKKSITDRAKRMREMADFFSDSETIAKMKGDSVRHKKIG
ncbi:MAG: hypothetical protein LBI18_10600 [Planctomycetaceae bacterium]|jgi:hypothetical protein|nr:hypothetical protein [Planctomycetaceae bacterium]